MERALEPLLVGEAGAEDGTAPAPLLLPPLPLGDDAAEAAPSSRAVKADCTNDPGPTRRADDAPRDIFRSVSSTLAMVASSMAVSLSSSTCPRYASWPSSGLRSRASCSSLTAPAALARARFSAEGLIRFCRQRTPLVWTCSSDRVEMHKAGGRTAQRSEQAGSGIRRDKHASECSAKTGKQAVM